METYFSSSLLTLLLILVTIKRRTEGLKTSPDITTNVFVDDKEFQLEAFSWNQNDKILAKNNIKYYGKLKWFSLGNPVLVKVKDRLFHYSSNGFYTHIQLLTNEHKKLLAKKAKKVYNIEIEFDQIVDMPITAFTCEIDLKDNKTELTLKGEVKSFKSFPLRMNFKLDMTSNEAEIFNKSITRNETDFELKCKIDSTIECSSEIVLYAENCTLKFNIYCINYLKFSSKI